MKPKDLKFPYPWDERRPALIDQVLFVPDYYSLHRQWPMPAFSTIFGNDNLVALEFCSGNGTWIFEKAKANPTKNWVAVEWRFERVRKIWSKMKNAQLNNLLIVCGEAQTFAKEYLPDSCVSELFINFPDPWPKQKHAKNRLFQEPFVQELARISKPGASLTVVTDDPDYGLQVSSSVLGHDRWGPKFADPFYVTDWTDYGASYFDSLWRSKGRTIRYFQFGKT